jgi:hypothetical protein
MDFEVASCLQNVVRQCEQVVSNRLKILRKAANSI